MKYKYLSRLGKTDLKKLHLDWYTPSAVEKKVIMNWLDKSLFRVFKFFKVNYIEKTSEFPLLDYEKVAFT